MKRYVLIAIVPLTVLFAFMLVHEHKHTGVLHIVSVDVCADTSVTGVYGDREYTLSPVSHPAWVACYSPVRPEDVGKNLEAKMDTANGVITVTTGLGAVPYAISAVREIK
jgi:hypothetical protein